MRYARMLIEQESPEEYGYDLIRYNLSESSIADQRLSDLGVPCLLRGDDLAHGLRCEGSTKPTAILGELGETGFGD